MRGRGRGSWGTGGAGGFSGLRLGCGSWCSGGFLFSEAGSVFDDHGNSLSGRGEDEGGVWAKRERGRVW